MSSDEGAGIVQPDVQRNESALPSEPSSPACSAKTRDGSPCGRGQSARYPSRCDGGHQWVGARSIAAKDALTLSDEELSSPPEAAGRLSSIEITRRQCARLERRLKRLDARLAQPL